MTDADSLKQILAGDQATVGVIGLGYVGLPLALTMADAGKRVVGLDVDEKKVESLRRGESYIRHIAPEWVKERLGRPADASDLPSRAAGKIYPTADFSALSHCDAILICVPTPLTEGRDPDIELEPPEITTERATGQRLVRYKNI